MDLDYSIDHSNLTIPDEILEDKSIEKSNKITTNSLVTDSSFEMFSSKEPDFNKKFDFLNYCIEEFNKIRS